MAKSAPRIYFTARTQIFRFTLSSLMPSTRHYFYFERQLVDSKYLKPLGGKAGEPLITDTNGQITFDYFYDSGLTGDQTTLEDAQQKAATLAGVKEVVLSNNTAATLAEDFKDSSLSYFISHIRVQVKIAPESEYQEVSTATTPPASVDNLATIFGG